MKNSTRHKIQEAKYFLNQMEKFFENDDIFDYTLSAFLSATRNITFHMQKQYKHQKDFAKWYCQNQIEMSADKELEYLKKARNKDVHVEKIQTGATRQNSISGNAFIVKKGVKNKKSLKRDDQSLIQSKTKTVRRFFLKVGNENKVGVVPFCERQMNKLTKLVDECEKQFLKLKN